jgi:ABC-type iron transport system FetAB ATPase subunit
MATDRLRRALRAVPDDIKTRHKLADAYQTEGAAHMSLIPKEDVHLVNSLDDIENVLLDDELTSLMDDAVTGENEGRLDRITSESSFMSTGN